MNATTQSVHIIIIIIIIIMSFLNILDPKKRDIVVNEYLTLIKKIQQEKMNEKAGDLTRAENLKKVFDPVVKSTEKSTTAITNELTPLREEMRNLNENLVVEMGKKEKRKRDDTRVYPENVLQHYLHKSDKTKLDKYFGIQEIDGYYMMGDKEVTVDRYSNIHIEGITYKATAGLWALVMEGIPNDKEYTEEDFKTYTNIVRQTNILLIPPQNATARSRYKSTYKWRYILTSIRNWGYQQLQLQEHSSHDPHEEHELSTLSLPTISDNENQSGDGIQFLPSDIKGLTTKLHLLLAEFAAGNKTSTRNEIVFILDELLKRKKISRKEYREINSYLSKCL